jgi:xylulokinase
MSLIGLDVGTTGCKAIVFSDEGSILGESAREYAVLTPCPGWAEQDAELVWRLAWDALREALARARSHSSAEFAPQALALSVQGEAIIPVDAGGRPQRSAILGMDTRTGVENQWLAEHFGAETLFGRTGMPLHTVNTLPKLLWLQRHEPEIWRASDQFLLYEDFFLRRLSGRATISHCLASRTQMYDLAAGCWAGDILEECGIEEGTLAPLAPQEGGVVGTMRDNLARELGLDQGLLLASGGHDQACAALGSGVVREGLAMVSTGTAEVVEVAMATPALNEVLRGGSISVYRHVVPGLYLAMTLNHSGGLLLRWFRDTLCPDQRDEAAATGRDAYDLMRAGAPRAPTRLLVLPHFAGSGTPWLDTTSRGAILGLTFATTRSVLAKAILEGLTFELRANIDLLRDAGVTISELRAVGGGARSPLWLQLKADICHVPLRVPQVTEAACLGAALLAGVAAGVSPDLETAVAQTVQAQRCVVPHADSMSDYDGRYQLYRRMYPALIDLHRQL